MPFSLLSICLSRPLVPGFLQRPGCGYVLCTVLLALVVLLAAAVTSAVLFLNRVHTPGTAPPPIVSTGPAGANGALVTVERADSSRLSILIDPRCPDLADGFARLEGAQASVLQALAERHAQPPPDGAQKGELLDAMADQLSRLLARASELQAECAGLRKGHGALGQGLSALQSEQSRLSQVRVCAWGPGWGGVPSLSTWGLLLSSPPGEPPGCHPRSPSPGSQVQARFLPCTVPWHHIAPMMWDCRAGSPGPRGILAPQGANRALRVANQGLQGPDLLKVVFDL